LSRNKSRASRREDFTLIKYYHNKDKLVLHQQIKPCRAES
jgi:hypothetical protein